MPQLLLYKQGGVELCNNFRVLGILKLHELVNTDTLTSGNGNIKRRLLLLSNMLPINPLRLGHNWVSREYHTVIEVKLKHSAKR